MVGVEADHHGRVLGHIYIIVFILLYLSTVYLMGPGYGVRTQRHCKQLFDPRVSVFREDAIWPPGLFCEKNNNGYVKKEVKLTENQKEHEVNAG